ncbi:hypothetical protein [Ralstonia sp. 24A2]|uniref:hypothetical protein n=1 Tax=Ralstonia sp. 24A2 TaxID=3447364 RepID=UPI003F69D74E
MQNNNSKFASGAFVLKNVRLVAMFTGLAVLAGCAPMSLMQPVERETLTAMQPVDVRVGIKQPELYAAFVPSNSGQVAAATCGAIPGIGILLAAACGGALGAVDAGINASLAKTAEETVRPLKDQLAEVNVNQQMRETVSVALQGVPDMQVEHVELTKDVTDKAYNESFMASQSGSVMFVNVDYHLSPDFSTLVLSTRSLLFPRSAKARVAAKQPQTVEAKSANNELAVAPRNSVYRANITYNAKLATPGKDAAQNVAAWNQDNGRLLRAALNDGIAQMGRLMADNLQRKYEANANANATQVKGDNGVLVSQISKGDTGSLLRYPNGSLQFNADLNVVVASFDAARQAGTAVASAQVAAPAVSTAPAAPAADKAAQ